MHAVTRELKIALLIGFCLVLVVSVLIADHLSAARNAKLAEASGEQLPLVRDPLGTDMPVVEPGAGIAPGPLATMPATTDPLNNPAGATIQPQDSTLVAATNETHPETYAMVGPTAVREPEATPAPLASTAANPEAPFTLVQGAGQQGVTNTTPNVTNSPDPRTLVARNDGTQANTDETLFAAAAREGVNLISGNGNLPAAIKVNAVNGSDATAVSIEPLRTPTESAATYTVKSGDNLYKIAKKLYGNGEKWRTLADANKDKISKNGNLKVGAVLKVPGMKPTTLAKSEQQTPTGPTRTTPSRTADRDAESSVVAKTTTKPDVKPETKKGTTYTVKAGDSLGKISQATLGTSKRVNDIIAANKGKLHDADDIKVGMVLAIPAR
jgi:nucleoid-associated protein YgaU